MTNILTIAYDEARHTNLPLAAIALGGTEHALARSTILKTLGELTDEGWLECVREAKPSRSARYKLHLPSSVALNDPTGPDTLARWLADTCPLDRFWQHINGKRGPSRHRTSWMSVDRSAGPPPPIWGTRPARR